NKSLSGEKGRSASSRTGLCILIGFGEIGHFARRFATDHARPRLAWMRLLQREAPAAGLRFFLDLRLALGSATEPRQRPLVAHHLDQLAIAADLVQMLVAELGRLLEQARLDLVQQRADLFRQPGLRRELLA